MVYELLALDKNTRYEINVREKKKKDYYWELY